MIRLQVSVVALHVLLAASLLAQGAPEPDSSGDLIGTTSTEVWAGYSAGSTSAGVLGRHTGITLGLVGLRWNNRIAKSDSRSLVYTIDLIPAARVTPIIDYHAGVSQCPPPDFDCARSDAIARGVGVSPLGVTAIFGAHRAVQWRLGGSAGVIMFDRPAPSDLATKFNFTAAIEAGVQVVNAHGTGLTVVYRLHHLSNAGTGNDNLAMLSHVISMGMRWRLAK
jgi:hypothetical protein